MARNRHDDTPDKTLGDLSGAMIVVACERCNRKGRYRRSTAIRKYGAGYDVRAFIVQVAADCKEWHWPKHGKMPWGCSAKIVE
jgi:hypothetical protein